MGKTKGVEERLEKHVGTMLTPPFSPERAQVLPPWTTRDVVVQGKSWDQSTVDISIAGMNPLPPKTATLDDILPQVCEICPSPSGYSDTPMLIVYFVDMFFQVWAGSPSDARARRTSECRRLRVFP